MSFTTSLNGIANAQAELNVISNNLANANTTGFKSSSVNFSDLVSGSAYSNPKTVEGIGSTVKSIDQNFTDGAIETTSSSTDLAVNGQGFFTVANPATQETYYTRNGNFSLSSGGNLVDSLGNNVQMLPVNASGTVTSTTPQPTIIPATDAGGAAFESIAVNTSGMISAAYADGTTAKIGVVALATFLSPGGLLQVGNQNWQQSGISGNPTYAAPGGVGVGTILSGSLEESNVDVSTQLVDLIAAQQYFQANSKAISTNSQMITNIMNATQG